MSLSIIVIRTLKESILALAYGFTLGIRVDCRSEESRTALTAPASHFVIMDGRSEQTGTTFDFLSFLLAHDILY